MNKNELRKIYKEKRRALPLEVIDKLTDMMLIHFQKLPVGHIEYVHSYNASEKLKEVSTQLFIDYLDFIIPELKVVMPKTNAADGSMQNILWEETTEYAISDFGIEEPVAGQEVETNKIDLVLVPLLCFDAKGFRVGYGKGFYDRLLKDLRADAITVGLSFFEPVEAIDDRNEFDVSLNYCITPERIYEF